jgi:pyruvate kinase
MGAYPQKALGVLRSVATRMEEWVRDEKYGAVVLPQIGETSDGQISEEVKWAICTRAVRVNWLQPAT